MRLRRFTATERSVAKPQPDPYGYVIRPRDSRLMISVSAGDESAGFARGLLYAVPISALLWALLITLLYLLA